MLTQAALNRLVLMHTNMQGQGKADNDDFVRLETLIKLVADGHVHMLCISETKINVNILAHISNLLSAKKLNFRMSNYDKKASRGTLIIYDASTLPFTVGTTRVEINKRAVSITLHGGNGLTLTVSCSYFEDIKSPHNHQEAFYKHLAGDIKDPNNPKQLYIDMGDKNCVINHHTQRYPFNPKGEPNQHLLRFMKQHNLIEVLTTNHTPETQIFTRSDPQKSTRAKLDHIIANEAAYHVTVASGWTEDNPFIKSDHGIIWASLDKNKLDLIKLPAHREPDRTHSGTTNIRLKGAKDITHTLYTGIPLRFINPNNTITALTLAQISELVSSNGYIAKDHLVRRTKREQHLHDTFVKHDKECGTSLSSDISTRDAIKWNNTAKEWRIHVKNETITRHLMSRGPNSVFPTPQNGTTLHTSLETPTCIEHSIKTRTNHLLDWHLEIRGKTTTKKSMMDYLTRVLKVPTKHISSLRENKALLLDMNNQISNTQILQIWTARFRTEEQCTTHKSALHHPGDSNETPLIHHMDDHSDITPLEIPIGNDQSLDALANHNTWNIQSSGKPIPKNKLLTYLKNALLINSSDIKHVWKNNHLTLEPGKTHTNRTETWSVTFVNSQHCHLWARYATPFQAAPDAQLCTAKDIILRTATGWATYKARINETLKHENTLVTNPIMMATLTEYTNDSQNTGSDTTTTHTDPYTDITRVEASTDDLWDLLTHITQQCAINSFGKYGKASFTNQTSLTTYYYKWIRTLSLILRDSVNHTNLRTLQSTHHRSLGFIPIPQVWPVNHTDIPTWRAETESIVSNIRTIYHHFKRKNAQESMRQNQRQLDYWFMQDLDRYLNETMRPPQNQKGGGADWPTDAYGQIPMDPHTRLALNKDIYQQKTESRIHTAPDTHSKPWLKELMQTRCQFSENSTNKIEKPFTMKDLMRTFSQLKMHAAPGPTGIRNPQWKNAPDEFLEIFLALLNKIYTSGSIPERMKHGIIFPIPKKPDKPCTSDNSRPLTMLESGLKILTHCISNRLYDELEQHPIFAPLQYAFLPNKNITDPIKLVELTQHHARKHNNELHQVFMDLTQAFDRLEFWAGDLAMERMSFPPKVKNLLNDLNENSRREVITKDGVTHPWTLECGVPQGEVLSPLRFIAVMDMLAAWIVRRCNGHNPKNKIYGYSLKPKKTLQQGQLSRIDQSINHYVRVTGNMFCDDIQLTTDSFEDMQDLVGIVQEFMTTFGIPINASKSYYTANLPSKKRGADRGITCAPSLAGAWRGGLDGEWVSDTSNSTPITIKQDHEPIRYLGVHFTMNGSWDHQTTIIKEALDTCLGRIRTKGLPPEQLAYLINTIIIPKLTFPLNASTILTGTYKNLTTQLDKKIANFAIQYLGYPKSTNHAYLYVKTCKWGLGLQSIEDQTKMSTITNTTISLNELGQPDTFSKINTHTAETDSDRDLRSNYETETNVYPKALLQSLSNEAANPANTSLVFLLKAHFQPNNKTDNFVKSLITPFTQLGYTIDAKRLTYSHGEQDQVASCHTNWLSRCLTKATFDKMNPTLMSTDLWHMGSFTYPCGTKLQTWPDTLHTLGYHPKLKKRQWFHLLERETLLDPDSATRTLKPEFRDTPLTTEPLQAFVYQASEGMLMVIPTQTTNSYDYQRKYEKHLITHLPAAHKHTITPVGHTFLSHDALPFDEEMGTPIPICDTIKYTIMSEDRSTPLTMDMDTYQALSTHYHKHTRINATKCYAQTNSSGSMISSTNDSETEQVLVDESIPIDNNSYSDGSVYNFRNSQTCAGYATARLRKTVNLIPGVTQDQNGQDEVSLNTRVTYREYLPSHPTWTSSTTTLAYNPSTITSYRAESKGLDKTLGDIWNDWTEDEPIPLTHLLDNYSTVTTSSTPHKRKNIRHPLREAEHYTLGSIRTKLTALNLEALGTEPNMTIRWIKGHSGNKLHELTDRMAARVSFRHTKIPERFPAYMKHQFCLYYYECLIEEDVRAHIQLVCKEIWLKTWRQKPSQGQLSTLSKHVEGSLPKLNTKGISPKDSKLYAKSINNISHTPRMQNKQRTDTPPSCPLCGYPLATEDHILFHCPDPTLTQLRHALDQKLTETITTNANMYKQPHPVANHPIESIPLSVLYPYAVDFPVDARRFIINALPESRWYRMSSTQNNYVTIQHPVTSRYPWNPEEPKRFNRIPVDTFWKLIAWHDITQNKKVLKLWEYDARAKDVWDAITNTKHESGDESLCWAADTTLLDILIDECSCTTELFSNIMNTYHRFKRRYSLYSHPSFINASKLYLDGLSDEAYVGCVYGNPPFDGRSMGKNTIIRALDKAEQVASMDDSFRAVFFLPLSPAKLEQRLTHPCAKLLMTFPNGTVPFTPDSHWYGTTKGQTACYEQSSTNLVLIMYEKPSHTNHLPLINHERLNAKLAAWYMSIMPETKCTYENLKSTGLDMAHFQLNNMQILPEAWRIWLKQPADHITVHIRPTVGTEPVDSVCVNLTSICTEYIGSTHDSRLLQIDPIRDVITWSRKLALAGCLPDTYTDFLHILGHTKPASIKLAKEVSSVLRRHLATTLRTYWKITSKPLPSLAP